jgi:hypothetical protein
MRNSLAAFALLVGALYAMAVDTGLARAADCKEWLDNNLYTCSLQNEDGSSGSFCAQLDASGSTAGKFTIDDGTSTYQCTCSASKKFNSAEFNESKEFLCGNLTNGNALTARVINGGKKIKQGEFFCNDSCDRAGVFECELDPECGL